jgi:hypothetical protein
MLTDDDRAALVSILSRYISLWDQQARDEKTKEEVEERLKINSLQRKNCNAALTLYGYPVDEDKVFDRLKVDLGPQDWNRAFVLARPKVVDISPSASNEKEKPADGEAGAPETTAHPSSPETINSDSRAAAKPLEPPIIKDVILERLKEAGEAGAKASSIREFIETTYSVKIHEKTVGMSLYRLQKAEKVRRNGLIWFLSTPKADGENPGAGTPGPINEAT